MSSLANLVYFQHIERFQKERKLELGKERKMCQKLPRGFDKNN
jgi:hypothetical protein